MLVTARIVPTGSMVRRVLVLGALLLAAACLGDPVGPGDLRVTITGNFADTAWNGAPGEALSQPVVVRVTDSHGTAVSGASILWRVQGRGASVTSASGTSDLKGEASAQWVLGTDAKELQVLRITAQSGSSATQLVLQAHAVPHIVTRLTLPIDSMKPLRVGDSLALAVVAIDPYGNAFPAPDPVVSLSDTTIARVGSGVLVGGPRRGLTTLRVTSTGVETTAPVHVVQYVAAIIPDRDTIRVASVGARLSVLFTVRDDRNRPVIDTAVSLAVADTEIVHSTASGDAAEVLEDAVTVSLVTVSNGSTQMTLSVPGVTASVQVEVAQVPAAITAAITATQPILALPQGATVPITCTATDSSGSVMTDEPVLLGSKNGTVVGGACSQLHVVHSGMDTLSIGLGDVRQQLPVVIAVPPTPDSPLGQPVMFDSLLPGAYRWTPSVRRNSAGEIELYLTQYAYPDSGVWPRGDLYRFVSTDGLNFRNDGIALQHGIDPCGPDGSGIENLVIAPRSDGPGWRMYYAAGSWGCYGWQVFSATSTDERTWVKEPGVRLSNGGELFSPPSPPSDVPWPVGEGMVIDQLEDGNWRMLTASFEHVLNPAPDAHWQITEWRSPDQLLWTYEGIAVGTSGMPPEAEGSVYSPTIVEFAPHLYRMFFTGDNRRLSTDPHSALWSAVSTDERTWQVEGQVIGESGIDVYYAAAVGDRLYFLTNAAGQWSPVPRVSRVQMP
jgi:hypothetical protein